eukprot:CAMPEP_0115867256 /NCGR_PEP_ID=MMETSP0287-20121206/20674_1 /TAXON_ID=412157 /ORGANISM="Chrysochromulina rotalis, Strain UIO044" /LENGTH=145 /DNA_ID=CAMNT_0003321855 /DNA_START=209 /DNA_END=643 /DNA_ORIENTATION=-
MCAATPGSRPRSATGVSGVSGVSALADMTQADIAQADTGCGKSRETPPPRSLRRQGCGGKLDLRRKSREPGPHLCILAVAQAGRRTQRAHHRGESDRIATKQGRRAHAAARDEVMQGVALAAIREHLLPQPLPRRLDVNDELGRQ